MIRLSHSGPCPALKFATVVGSSSSEEAKIGGITPEVLSLSGRCEDWPSNMRLPTWRLGYWISSRRCARSMNTMKAITATAIAITTRISPVDNAPWRPSSRVPAIADGSSATMPDRMMSEMPLPMPRDGDLLAEPHQEHGAAGERDHGRDAEEQARDR